MGKKNKRQTERRHVRLFIGDWERLQELYPNTTPSSIIARLTESFIRRIEEKQAGITGAPSHGHSDIELTLDGGLGEES